MPSDAAPPPLPLPVEITALIAGLGAVVIRAITSEGRRRPRTVLLDSIATLGLGFACFELIIGLGYNHHLATAVALFSGTLATEALKRIVITAIERRLR